MNTPKLLVDVFNNITVHGNREMTTTRFMQAVEELFNSEICPLCGKRKVKIDGGWEHICTQIIEKL